MHHSSNRIWKNVYVPGLYQLHVPSSIISSSLATEAHSKQNFPTLRILHYKNSILQRVPIILNPRLDRRTCYRIEAIRRGRQYHDWSDSAKRNIN